MNTQSLRPRPVRRYPAPFLDKWVDGCIDQKPVPACTSWWTAPAVQQDRQQFDQMVSRERTRMAAGRFGTQRDLQRAPEGKE